MTDDRALDDLVGEHDAIGREHASDELRTFVAGYLVGCLKGLGGDVLTVEAHDDGERYVPSFTVYAASGARVVVNLDRFDL
jgi:hypothetical protein